MPRRRNIQAKPLQTKRFQFPSGVMETTAHSVYVDNKKVGKASVVVTKHPNGARTIAAWDHTGKSYMLGEHSHNFPSINAAAERVVEIYNAQGEQ